jgi:hypothetical protein
MRLNRGGKIRNSNFPKTDLKNSLRKYRKERDDLERLAKFESGL